MGPLRDIRVVEMAGMGPAPFAAMMLADMGAGVIRLERRGGAGSELATGAWNAMNRGRPSVGVDIKHPAGRDLVGRLVESGDALIEGFRPGVMERHGLGPDELLSRNERLVYARITGYGQQGPLAAAAGHDINYISLAGVLGAIARKGERPLFPMNLLGDFGGGGMLAAFGIVCGILEARRSGRGQVMDAAMVEGSAVLSTMIHALRSVGMWTDQPGTNLLDSGAHFYEVYETADGRYVAVGAVEPEFYAELLRVLEIDADEAPQMDRDRWPELKRRFAEIFRSRTRDEWAERFRGADACATPVLDMDEAPGHPHNAVRETFIELGGVVQPAPAPRFSRTRPKVDRPPSDPGADTAEALAGWGLAAREIASLRQSGAID